jgi:hypothetical protein
VLVAQNPPPTGSQTPPTGGTQPTTEMKRDKDREKSRAGKTHKMSAEIVSTDASAKTITVRSLSGSDTERDRQSPTSGTAETMSPTTLRLEGKAGERLSGLKPGDRVMLSCRHDSSMGSTGTAQGTGSTSGSTTQGAGTSSMTDTTRGASAQCSVVTDISKSR